MNKSQAEYHGTGYACGREDVSGIVTSDSATDPEMTGYVAFGTAYGAAWDEYNRDLRYMMTTVQRAYDAWQKTAGVSIFSDPRDRTDAMQARRAARTS